MNQLLSINGDMFVIISNKTTSHE